MSHPDEARLARLAEYARAHPSLYRARVAALAVLGYAYLLGVLALLAFATAVLVYGLFRMRATAIIVKLALPLLWLLGMGVKSLWIRLEEPKGIVLRPSDAPALMAEIEAMRRATGAGRLHRVLLTDEMNAGVTQLPRLGVFGWYRNYLVLGLPLLAATTVEEFRAVLAHEFGHISGRHGRFGNWLHRVRSTWHRVAEELRESGHAAQGIFNVFFRWYAPFFDSYIAVLSRQQEFEADRAAARAAGAPASAAALCRVAVADGYLGRAFWPGVFEGIRQQPGPPAAVFQRLWDGARTAAADARAGEWLGESLGQPTAPWDSHPSLSERLAALGVAAPAPEPLTVSAADALLGASAARWVDQMSRTWWGAVHPAWAREHQNFLRNSERRQVLEAEGELDAERALERLHLVMGVRGGDAAVPLLRAYAEAGGRDAGTLFILGQELVTRRDEEGLAHLARAMELDANFILPACHLAVQYFSSTGRRDEAAAYQARIQDRVRALEAADGERSVGALRNGDVLLPHGLAAQQVEAVREAVALVRGIKRVLLVRKQVSALPEMPHWIVLVQRRRRFWPGRDSWTAAGLVEQVLRIVEPLGGTSIAATAEGKYRRLARRAAKVHGAEIYRAGGWMTSSRPAADNPGASAGIRLGRS
ncbi:MAG TPA: M48 family metallopeptidase [Longimicrobium sp.]|jgi:Zn-dependent protease with chaperone function|uniref:M48 family metallopeptidase n=1 Tax=Longimicrobium sp. TaxID=2029185 RepID=UPI002ED9EC18